VWIKPDCDHARQPWEAKERRAVMKEAAADLKKEIKWIVIEETHGRTIAAVIISVVLLLAGIGGGYLLGPGSG
jgi:hypothetical protein